MTNSSRIAHRLRKAQCSGNHVHTHLINFKARACEVHPGRFCQDVCMGIKEEVGEGKLIDKVLSEFMQRELSNIEEPPRKDIVDYEWLYSGRELYDDITGEYLDKERAISAR